MPIMTFRQKPIPVLYTSLTLANTHFYLNRNTSFFVSERCYPFFSLKSIFPLSGVEVKETLNIKDKG